MAYRLSPQAEADLDEIWFYIARQSGSTDRARRVVAQIAERFDLLAAQPRMGRARDELRPGLRSPPAGNYLIFHRIEAADVVILRILHARRDPRRLRDRP